MTKQVADFITGLLEYMVKNIEVADRHHVISKQKRKVRIKMCDNNRDTCIATLHNVLLAPDICDRLFSIITLMNLGHICLFHKGFCTVYFGSKMKNVVTLPHSAQRKHTFLGEIENVKNKEITI